MGWNGSGTSNRSSDRTNAENKASKRNIWHILIVLVSGCLLFYIAYYLLRQTLSGQNESEPAKIDKRIKVVNNFKPSNSSKTECSPILSLPQRGEGRLTESNIQSVFSSSVSNNVLVIPFREGDMKPCRFEFTAEEQIADLLEIEPGEPLLGEIPYNRHFLKSLKESFAKDIEIKPDDDDYTRELKKQVSEVKKDFQAKLNSGIDICSEMSKTREALQELGMYREKLMAEVLAISKDPKYTQADLNDLKSAAQEMLKSKGIENVEFPKFMFRHLKLKEKIK